ncbi:MAG: MMPL family transporter [Gammaproteobacteria bacterium]|nr:MMPL family transporter [Gammaproteobacteria bacterium]MYD02665.1 MMPL family transporter [Gammaproteobacteria bacterium]MYI25982.1 MMPL family transporter [Gammaproteobacteria bacterium]
MNPALLDRYIAAVLRYRWLVVAAATLVMLAMAAGGRFITVSNDHRILFGEDNPQLAAYDALEDTYTSSNTALIAVSPRQGNVFTRETLGVIERMTEEAWQAPYSSRVDSLTNYSHSEALGDDLIVGPLVEDAASLSDADLDRIEEIANDSIELVGRMLAEDGRVAGLAINFIPPRETHDASVVELNAYLDEMMARARAESPEIDFHITGDIVMQRAFAQATQDDLERLTPIVFFLIVAVAYLILRSISGALSMVVMILFSVGTAMGLAGWNQTVFSPVNAGVPIIVMAITVAQSVHITTMTLTAMRRGLDRMEAVAESVRVNAFPVFLASLTTVIGFLSLNASDSPPFHTLGNYVAFGVACTFVYSMSLLPALLSILPLRVKPSYAGEVTFFDRFGEFVVARRKPLLWLTTIPTLLLLAGIFRIELNDSLPNYFDERYEFRRDSDYIIENLTGLESQEYSLASPGEGGITNPEYLRQIDAFAEWCRSQPEVTYVRVFSDTMKRLNKNMHEDDPAYYRLPEDQALATQYLLLYELSLPFGMDLNDRIDISKSSTRMSVVMRDITSNEQQLLAERARGWLAENAPGLTTEATGLSVIVSHITERNIKSMLRGTVIAMALISLVLVVVFKSLRFGLLSLIPNFIPAGMSFGLWGYLVGRVGIAASVVTVVAFGIIVDDTIHFLTKYLKIRREGRSAADAVRYAFSTVGKALGTTTAVLSAGFLVFAASGFEVSWALGILVAMTIMFAFLADFLLLPPLLMAFDRRKL